MEEWKGEQSAVDGTRRCKLNSCSKEFKPKKSNQLFCEPKHKDVYHKLATKKGEALMNSKGIRYANLDNSDRLQRLVRFLSDGEEHSTRDIVIGAEVMAVGTAISELRSQLPKIQHYAGFEVYQITCKYRDGNYYYKMCKSFIDKDQIIAIHHFNGDTAQALPIEEHKEKHKQGNLF
jgi:hypothetical protein